MSSSRGAAAAGAPAGAAGGAHAAAPPALLACPICVETIEDAFVTPCGHTFCFKCISTHLKNKSSCPSCGGHLVQDQVHPNFLLNKLIQATASAQQGHSLKTALLQHVQADLAASGAGGICLSELDAAITMLQERRQQVATHESASKLQLLLLFLQHARSRQQGQLSDLEQQLEVLEQDLAKAREAATADGGSSAVAANGASQPPRQQQAEQAPQLQQAAAVAAAPTAAAAAGSRDQGQRLGGPGSAFRRLPAPPAPHQQEQALPSPQQPQQPHGFRPFGQGSPGLSAPSGFRPYPRGGPAAAAAPAGTLPPGGQAAVQQAQGAAAGQAAGVSHQQQPQQGFRRVLPAAVGGAGDAAAGQPPRAVDAADAADAGGVELPPEKRRRILAQFDDLQQAYVSTRLHRASLEGQQQQLPATAVARAAAAAAAGAVAAAEQQQVQGEQQAQEQQHLRQRRLSDSDAEGPSSAAAAVEEQQQQAGGGGGAAAAAPAAAELDVFQEMLYAVTHFSRLEPVACIPPPTASASAGAATRGSGANILSSVEFDCRGQLFAAAGVQQHVLVHDYHAVLEQCSGGGGSQAQQQQQGAASSGIMTPLLDISMSSKLSCVSFSPTVQHYLLSSDYEGQVHLLDVTGGRVARQWGAHDKRIWAVDFCPLDANTFATGSDDGTVKVWGLCEPPVPRLALPVRANVCSLEFSPAAQHLLAVSSAGHQVHLFDLRSPRRPLAVLKGHGRAVSYVRWARPDTLVTASTDATLRLWTASGGRGSSGGMPGGSAAGTAAAAAAAAGGGGGSDGSRCSSDGEEGGWHCTQVFQGHANSKHFVGLAAHGPFIACGSETNEVFIYHHGLAQPSMRAPLLAPAAWSSGGGGGGSDGSGGAVAAGGDGAPAAPAAARPPFVSALAWRPGSDVLLAANSRGGMWLLGMQ